MNWLEKHWILAVVIIVVVGYLYTTYGVPSLGSGSQQQG